MEAKEQKTKRNKTVGMVTSITIHALILLLCFFWLAWTPPDPPLPVYGIEVNLGNVDAGSGNQQQLDPQPDPVEDPSEDPSESSETTEETSEENSEDATLEEPREEPVEQYETDNAAVNENNGATSKPKAKTENTAKPKSNTATNNNQSKPKAQNNNGDQEKQTGDQGNPDGEVDAKALYGNPGGQGGSSLDMSGWTWDYKPRVKDESDESGRIVFKVLIDDMGEILSVEAVEKTVSPAIVKIYENEVRRLTFSKTRDNASAAPTSTGKITFIIRSK